MATSITPLRLPTPEPAWPLRRVHDRVLSLARDEGHTPVLFPEMCVSRFSGPTTYCKAANFGVTLAVTLQGSKHVRVGRHELTMEPGRLLVFTRDLEHESAALDATPDRPFLGLGISFSPERVAGALLALAEAGGATTEESVPAFWMPCDAPLAGALERLLDSVEDPVDRKLLAPLAIHEILFRLLRSDAAAAVRNAVGRAPDANRILEVMQFMRGHYTEKLTVEQLARRVAMSPSHFAHRFRAVVRTSPMRYLRDLRLDRARALLLEDGTRVSEVAVRVGFESPAHFAREFKRRFGMAPSKSLLRAGSGVGTKPPSSVERYAPRAS